MQQLPCKIWEETKRKRQKGKENCNGHPVQKMQSELSSKGTYDQLCRLWRTERQAAESSTLHRQVVMERPLHIPKTVQWTYNMLVVCPWYLAIDDITKVSKITKSQSS